MLYSHSQWLAGRAGLLGWAAGTDGMAEIDGLLLVVVANYRCLIVCWGWGGLVEFVMGVVFVVIVVLLDLLSQLSSLSYLS